MTYRAISAVTLVMLLFELCRVVHLDRPLTPVGESSIDFFPRAALIFHLRSIVSSSGVYRARFICCRGIAALILEYERVLRQVARFTDSS
jgi:hypothetical protein